MTGKTAERVFPGEVASRGLVLGTTELHRAAAVSGVPTGNPEEERARLERALEAAEAALSALAGQAATAGDETGAEVIEFQVALASDPELAAPARAEIDAGASAAEAWRRALDAQIADYLAAEDEYFRARASDLADLQERVIGLLAEPGAPAAAGAAPGATAGSATADPIYLARDLTPSRFLEIDWARYRGAALLAGSASSHVAILARARGVPLLVGLAAEEAELPDGALAVLDATPPGAGANGSDGGRLVINPAPETASRYAERLDLAAEEHRAEAALLDRPAVTAGGAEVSVMINVDEPALLDGLDPGHCDGIGLTRSEFLFHGAGPGRDDELPDEARQLAAYRRLLDWAGGRPVTVRTLDAGGDKPIPGLTPEADGNPFLGVRGLRLSLARPEVFAVQLRALARAAAGPGGAALKVMLPMVTLPEELAEARGLLEAAVEALRAEGLAARLPALGIMVEVPACALDIAAFDADFYSIGSNDLVQYVMAAARDNPALGTLHRARHPAVLELIRRVVAHGEASGREVSLCGDMAGDPEGLAALLDLGLRKVSVAPAALGRVKAAVARHGASPAGGPGDG